MFRLLFVLVVITVVTAKNIPKDVAEDCNPETCQLPECRCSSTEIPGGLTWEETPQFVHLTFDDAITTININYYTEAFDGRYNPDGCPLAATFYVSHEYTYYDRVHSLYANGHEIALHSITHKTDQEYWKTASVDQARREFSEQRELMAHFANISYDDMQGMRLPFLQISGDNTFLMMAQEDLLYDCSWPTRQRAPGLWPYTLHYATTQECVIVPCPTSSIPGPWVIPMLSWLDLEGTTCSMVDGCPVQPQTEDDIYEWMIENFNSTYNSNKAPWGFYVHSAWFSAAPVRFAAYLRFVDYLQSIDDVYIVGQAQAVKWTQNPIPLSEMTNSEWSQCRQRQPVQCNATNCVGDLNGEQRWYSVCGQCPPVYPWIDNIFGLAPN